MTSAPQTLTPRCTSRPGAAHDGGRWRIEPTSRRFALGAALGVGVGSFLATELMHYVLVPDLGQSQERLLAEGLSAFIVCCLMAKLAHITRDRHRLTLARTQVVAEMNHHIRNALTSIFLSAHATENQQLIRVISEGVDRIDWALREILPREIPLREEQRDRIMFAMNGALRASRKTDDPDVNLRIGERR
jgi:signal transduction histidine kinase